MRRREPESPDPLARILEAGLAAVVVLAPMPFGAVVPMGRLCLELLAFALLAVWLLRALKHPVRGPSRWIAAGLGSLLLLTLVQALPLGEGAVSLLSPRIQQLRQSAAPPPEIVPIEERLLGTAAGELDPSPSLSVAPGTTASALRTGAALAALLLVACTVAAVSGVRTLAVAAALSAAFQGIYGLLVLVSGHDMIWHVAKRYYLDCATGTFINRNHFAGFLAATLPVAAAFTLAAARRWREGRPDHRVADWFGREGSLTLAGIFCAVTGLAGLLLSFSRAGIAFGLLALCWTLFTSGRRKVGRRVLLTVLVVLVAAVPLAQIGADRLTDRYADTADALVRPGLRLTVWVDTAGMLADFPVTGTGFGTFSDVYPSYRSPEVRRFYDHAHNDALQFLAEGGLVGGALLLLVLVPVGRRLVRGLVGGLGPTGVGVAAGLGALLLHALIDFNFHIPSNAALAVVLAGTLEGLTWRTRT